jgi:hypothetical protein
MYISPKGQQHAVNPATRRLAPRVVLKADSPQRLRMIGGRFV